MVHQETISHSYYDSLTPELLSANFTAAANNLLFWLFWMKRAPFGTWLCGTGQAGPNGCTLYWYMMFQFNTLCRQKVLNHLENQWKNSTYKNDTKSHRRKTQIFTGTHYNLACDWTYATPICTADLSDSTFFVLFRRLLKNPFLRGSLLWRANFAHNFKKGFNKVRQWNCMVESWLITQSV